MNSTVLKKAHRLYVHQDRIRFRVGNLDVDWHVPGVNGGGRAVNPDDIKRASVTAAFKKGEVGTTEDNLEFSRGKITVRIPLLDEAEDHTPLPTDAPSAMPWEPGIMGVREAASGEDYRAIFRGVQFEPERIVASDGFRLFAMDTPTPAEKPTVIEAVALDMLKQLKPERYWFADDGMYAAGEDWAAYVPAMGGEYTDYMRVVPKEVLKPAVRVVSEDWRELLKTANQTNPDRDPHRLDLHADGSVSHEQIHIEGVFSPLPVEQSYNGKYLLEALVFTGNGSELLLSGPQAPTLVRNSNRWAVIVPLRV